MDNKGGKGEAGGARGGGLLIHEAAGGRVRPLCYDKVGRRPGFQDTRNTGGGPPDSGIFRNLGVLPLTEVLKTDTAFPNIIPVKRSQIESILIRDPQ